MTGPGDPGRGDLAALNRARGTLEDSAAAAARARSRLSSLTARMDGDVWRGSAASAFKDSVDDDALEDLQDVERGFAAAAEAFAAYIAAVDGIAEQARSLRARIRDAAERYEDAAARLARAAGTVGVDVEGCRSAPPPGSGSCITVTGPVGLADLSVPLALAGDDAARTQAQPWAREECGRAQAEAAEAWELLQYLYRQWSALADEDRAGADTAFVAALRRARKAAGQTSWKSFWKGVLVVAAVLTVLVFAVAVLAVAVTAIAAVGLLASSSAFATLAGSMALTGGLGTALTTVGVVGSGLSLAGHAALGDSSWHQVGFDLLGVLPGCGLFVRGAGRLGPTAFRAVQGPVTWVRQAREWTAVQTAALVSGPRFATPGHPGAWGADALGNAVGAWIRELGSSRIHSKWGGYEFWATQFYGVAGPVRDYWTHIRPPSRVEPGTAWCATSVPQLR